MHSWCTQRWHDVALTCGLASPSRIIGNQGVDRLKPEVSAAGWGDTVCPCMSRGSGDGLDDMPFASLPSACESCPCDPSRKVVTNRMRRLSRSLMAAGAAEFPNSSLRMCRGEVCWEPHWRGVAAALRPGQGPPPTHRSGTTQSNGASKDVGDSSSHVARLD